MAAENISSFESWVENVTTQLESMSNRFSEMEALVADTPDDNLPIIDMLREIKDVEKEFLSLKHSNQELSTSVCEMTSNVTFQLQTLHQIHELLKGES